MDIQNIALDTSVIRLMPFDKYKNDFSFIVDGEIYLISRIEADLISPIIRKSHSFDSTIDTFYINTNGNFPGCKFTDFLSLLSFQPQNFDVHHQYYFKYLLTLLGNDTESSKIRVEFFDTLTINYVNELISHKSIFLDQTAFSNEIKNFIAIHFTEFKKEELKKLDIEFLDSIIKNDDLQIDEEDSLFEFVIDLYIENKNASILFENIYYSNISENMFLRFMNIFDFNDFTSETWKLLKDRIINQQNDQILSRYSKKILYKKGNGLNGIIKYLTDKIGGNIHHKNVINISSSSNQVYYGLETKPYNLCDFNDLSRCSMWSPDNQKNSFVIFDFKTRKIQVTDYTFHTPIDQTDDYPKSWVVECSNDLNHWVKVDERKDESVMNDFDVCHTFHCQIEPGEPYQYIRFTSTGPSWKNPSRFYFDISAIEFFGTLIKSNLLLKKKKPFFGFF